MNKRFAGLVLAVSATLAVPAWSQDKPQAAPPDAGAVVIGREPGGAVAGGVRTRSATITKIDSATRDITLKRPDGNEVTIRAGDAVKNFDQLKVGDVVTLKQGAALLVELRKVEGGGIRQRTDWVEVFLSQPGQSPGVGVRHTVHAVVNVFAIDHKKKTVTLRGVRETRKFEVDDPKLLDSLKVGDQVEATLVQGEALFVEPRGKAARKK
ncbi:hypothetical protein VAR608DRAFT_4240 [Variovorax sp. HW608]|uniref:hypothetical protein n=1 Tax=Variovorax sp. HW608 TaxID=1034889 RepID=UPI00081F9F6B|nr:hypothetical protein [Variovorax sp. HW608]SCK43784.1 hypothetical protein VAR608DRAFT_4240 [Variovorax sp. HW608]